MRSKLAAAALLTVALAVPAALPVAASASERPASVQVRTLPTARCRDGTLSYSKHRRGTCSHHKGVRRWLRHVPA
jgi:Protein of unknown function (DUF3761)